MIVFDKLMKLYKKSRLRKRATYTLYILRVSYTQRDHRQVTQTQRVVTSGKLCRVNNCHKCSSAPSDVHMNSLRLNRRA